MKVASRVVFAWLLLNLGQPVGATLVTFDDLTPAEVYSSGGQVPSGYAGLQWDNFYVYFQGGNVDVGGVTEMGITSGLNVFTLNAADIWGTGTLEVVGLYRGGLVGDDTFVLSSVPALLVFNFDNVDTVLFRAPGQQGGAGNGPYASLTMDNMVINEPNIAIPEAKTVFAGALLLVPWAFIGCRRLAIRRS